MTYTRKYIYLTNRLETITEELNQMMLEINNYTSRIHAALNLSEDLELLIEDTINKRNILNKEANQIMTSIRQLETLGKRCK